MTNPYRTFSDRAFWSRAVSAGVSANHLIDASRRPLIKLSDKIVSAGSCFAANIIPHLEKSGLTYLRTEQRYAEFADLPADRFGYDLFSAAYGNIYTARHLLQLLRRCRGSFTPVEDRWHTESGVIDPFRPGLLYGATFDREFEALTRQHLRRTLKAFTECTMFVFTFGLTEAWESVADGTIFPSCPGTVAGIFDPLLHRFINFSTDEIADDFGAFIQELREINPGVRMIITVSPVPLVATASNNHVLMASNHSKAKLIVAAHRIASEFQNVTYFPAYEIVTTGGYFAEDRRNVTQEGVLAVMDNLLACCEHTAIKQEQKPQAAPDVRSLAAKIVDAECEEMMADEKSIDK